MIWIKTKFAGVWFREHASRKFKRRADRSYIIRYNRNKKLVTETVGWETQGATIETALKVRGDILQNIRHGEGYQSLKEKREIETARREQETQAKAEIEKENTPIYILVERFLEWSQENKKSWKTDVFWAKKHILPELGNIPIKDLNPLALERFKRTLRDKKGLGPKSIVNILGTIRAMYNRGIAWNLSPGENPVTKACKLDRNFLKIPDNKRVGFFSREQAKQLLDELELRSPQLHDVALLSLHTGMRAGEIFNLLCSDLDFANETISIFDPKNGETRHAYMTPDVNRMLWQRIDGKPSRASLIFTDTKGNKIKEIPRTFDRAISSLGFNDGITDPRKKLVFHSLRHSFASWLAIAGESLPVIGNLMGHKSLAMTERYSHLSPDRKREAVKKIMGIP